MTKPRSAANFQIVWIVSALKTEISHVLGTRELLGQRRASL